MQVSHKIQVLRKRHTAILGDNQKTSDIHTNVFITKEKKMKNNNQLFLHGHEKKCISSPKLELKNNNFVTLKQY